MKIVYLKPEIKELLSKLLGGWEHVPIDDENRLIKNTIPYPTSFLSTDYFEVEDYYLNKDFYVIIKPERFKAFFYIKVMYSLKFI